MNPAQIHLALNHVPVLLSLTGGVILAFALIFKNPGIVKTGLALLIISAIAILPVYFSGEGTEDIVENLPQVTEQAIESHEDSAKLALSIMLATGLAAFISFVAIIKNFRYSKGLSIFTVALAAAAFIFSANTAHSGGLIRHQEIQNVTGSNINSGDQNSTEKQKEGKDSGGEKGQDDD